MKKTLIIIDIQKEFIEDINGNISNQLALNIYNFLNNNINYFSNFSNVIQIIDTINHDYTYSGGLENTLPNGIYISDEYIDNLYYEDEDNIVPYSKYINNIIYKEYGFFRNFIDSGYDDDFIIDLGKSMLENNILDSRDITKSNYNLLPEYIKDEFSFDDIISENNLLFLPQEEVINNILNNINKNDIITLIGGGENECLKEIYLLLKVLGYENIELDYNLIY